MSIGLKNCRRTVWLRVAIGAIIALSNAGPIIASVEPVGVGEWSAPAASEGELRTAAWPWNLFRPRSRAIYDSAGVAVTPHPAVARVIVPEGGVTAFGSGTLIDVCDQHGLVVTNWHVVKDSRGRVEVVFPNGFRSLARPLKLDEDWDLAALVIWRPPIEPVKVAMQPPRQGDFLTIHGYGRGQYRIATGRCTSYFSPRPHYPHEIVELDVEARQGDSGGPIFNQAGELAGVLFGAGEGTTLGSFAPRVRCFLASIAPDLDKDEQPLVAAADRPAPTIRAGALDQWANDSSNYPSSPWAPGGINRHGAVANGVESKPDDSQAADASAGAPADGESLSWADIGRTGWYEPLKSLLAVVGLAAISLRLVKAVR
jgi:S1-C subfamily serine protease